MDKNQMLKIRNYLGKSQCPICTKSLFRAYSIANIDITEAEISSYNKIDTSKDPIKLVCENCGYIMTFDKQILFR